MNSVSERLAYLFKAWYAGTTTDVEAAEFRQLLQEDSVTNKELESLMKAEWQTTGNNTNFFSAETSAYMLERILGHAAKKKVPVKRLIWKRIAAAAAIIVMFGMGIYWYTLKHTRPKELISKTIDVKPPASTKATITLAGGKQIVLDSAASGVLAKEGNVKVIKLADGAIGYIGTEKEVTYNVLTNPRGSKVVTLTLSDGTKVWLNAESSLRYPTAFSGKERKVEITGEGYFEVAHNAAMPFKVAKNDVEVTVLGTHFNVNAYADENEIKVTLLEGSVQVTRSGAIQKLSPGQQAVVAANGITLNTSADLNEVMAWKSGRFVFNSADIKTIMRQLSRWYDVDVVYKDEITNHFTGVISREVNAADVFNMLTQTGTVGVTSEPETGNKTKIIISRK